MLQDGDFSTAWTCAAGDCELRFDLFNYRHIKQVKIGEFLRILCIAVARGIFGWAERVFSCKQHRNIVKQAVVGTWRLRSSHPGVTNALS